jgi:hypothetical protein
MRFQTSLYSNRPGVPYGAFGVEADDYITARKRAFYPVHYEKYDASANISSSGGPAALSSRAKALWHGANTLYILRMWALSKMVETERIPAAIQWTDQVMYPYYTGNQGPKEILRFVRSQLESASQGKPSANQELEKFRAALTDALTTTTQEESKALETEAAVSAAAEAKTIDSRMVGKSWTDGRYTYSVAGDGTITAGNKKFGPRSAQYATIMTNLNKDFAAGKLTEKKPEPKRRSSGGGGGKKASSPTPSPTPGPSLPAGPSKTVEVPLTEQAWFWPAIIGGTVVLSGVLYFALRSPAPAPAAQ